MMDEDLEVRRGEELPAVRFGGLLLPAGLLILFGVAGVAVPALVRTPLLLLGGLAFALLVRVAASVRMRSEHTPGSLRLECDVRIRYRGAGRTAMLVAGSLAAMIALSLIAENFGRR